MIINPDPSRPYAEFLDILRRPTDGLTGPSIPAGAASETQEELFSVERLVQYAGRLAAELQTTLRLRRGRSLLRELKNDGNRLVQAYLKLAASIREKQPVSPAAEWFVDNFHIIENQLREIKQDLPEDYYNGLPRLAIGELKGYPRVYGIALAIIAHTDSRLDVDALRRFLIAYQQVAPLAIGELWAIAITLRIVLVEHLTPIAARIVSGRENRAKADALADRLLALASRPETSEAELTRLLARELGEPKNFDRALVVQLIQRIRDQDPVVWPAFDWLEKQLNGLGTNAEAVTQLDHHRQAASQVTVGNIIASMRLLSTLDWREFFESVCLIDQTLARDPAGAYFNMDFGTRDSYRHAIERIAKRSRLNEIEIASRAVELSAMHPPGSRGHHVGFHLIGKGVNALEHATHYRLKLSERGKRLIRRHPAAFYLLALAGFTALFLVPSLYLFAKLGAGPFSLLAFGLLVALPASELALSLLHHYVNYFVHPRPLPRMETENGIPPEASTMIVIPTLFTKEKSVRDLVERLEIHSLANPESGLSFALLGDFADADTEVLPSDARILEIARSGIHALNARHCSGLPPKFHLFHRRRQWNASEGKWIGWERKRGKLLEFNRLLRGARDTSYEVATAHPDFLLHIQFVITLDSDSQLPRDAARKLIGTIIHPLNRPQYDARRERVTEGYGILQPRVSITSASAAATRFARAFSGNIGLDPYTTAVSDVYQDLFGEGTFTGKGLYVVDSFEHAMENRVPENTVLSHDLFESSYARSALVTDVELFDDYPADYDTFSARQHRWTRGDWQLTPWLFPRVPSAEGTRTRNRLSLLSRWKIFDNLRRSLVAPAALLWLLAAWSILPGSSFIWTALVVLMFLFPVYSTFVTGRWMHRRGITWAGHISKGLQTARVQLSQIILTLAFLPQQAWTQVDAIARVFYRKLISHRGLLEWTAFAQLEGRTDQPVSARELALSPGPITGFVAGCLMAFLKPDALPEAAPFIIAWITNPWLKRWIARKPSQRRMELGKFERTEFRGYARLTWGFFETFVGEEDHWLAPDNFQEDPQPVIAHRTSPTNIGLHLLSIASAYDLGYIGHHELITLVEKIFATLGRLPLLHGHFFNWYDTRSLEPLHPRYVSTVDSGNLAGHLLAFKQFLHEIGRQRRHDSQLRLGVEDTLRQLECELSAARISEWATDAVSVDELNTCLTRALNLIRSAEDSTWLESVFRELKEAHDMLEALSVVETSEKLASSRKWMKAAVNQIKQLCRDSQNLETELVTRGKTLTLQCDQLVLAMDFRFLFDKRRKLFHIGYNVSDQRRDNSYYDLLASESRLASFVAIAKGDVPQDHWFRLGRQLASVQGGRALIAWTATMFEYLMPVLVMRRYPDTLLDQTYETIVERQIEYGVGKGVPWGVSEAGFNARDLQLNYQYGPFGVPGLGLKRGLSDEMVVSPYSTFLAALVDPWAALVNLRALRELGALSRYGFYESIDYTAERLPKNQKKVILRSYMAHHQGMSLVAINNILNQGAMQRRFHSEPLIKATQLLLQERIPQRVALSRPRAEEVHRGALLYSSLDLPSRSYSDVHLSRPRTQLLSNGTYSVLVSSTGAGYSRCGTLAITRWREDPTCDQWGQFFYIRNLKTGRYWSAAHQSTGETPAEFEATLSEDKVEFVRRDGKALTHTEILVSPEDNVELRRVSVTNESREPRDYEITSFMEVVLAKPADDQAHPAFSNLFVQTEYVAGEEALLATRRSRGKEEERRPWGFHVLVTSGETVGLIQYETDRARFLGRGRSVLKPGAMREEQPLTSTVGSVLDPIFSLRRTVRVQPGRTAQITFATGIARSREEALGLIDKYHDIHIFAREAEIAWTQTQVQLRHLNITTDKAHTYQKLAGRMIYLDSALRARAHVLMQNTRTQSSLWAYGISGDLPILLTRISDEKDMPMVRELLHAHEYLRLKGLAIDLVILNERSLSYLQSLQDELQRQIRMSGSQALLDKPGGVFLRRTDLMPKEDVILLRTVARVSLNADRGTLDEQLKHRHLTPELPAAFVPSSSALRATASRTPFKQPKLDFFNGLGGFTSDGREYVIVLTEGQWTPAPWVNVIANSLEFGFVVSESGSGYTWSVNSRENRLTPWSNDPVSDPAGEAIYLRDEDTGEVWSPTPLPIRGSGRYLIAHGQGYSRFEHESHGLNQELYLFVAPDAEIKISRLRIKNSGTSPRKLSVTSYAEWVLGAFRGASAPFVIAEHDPSTDAIIARNPYNNEFSDRVAFAAISEAIHTHTCDRKEFLGRNGGTESPAALKRTELSGASGAGLDPCAAFQAPFELAPGEEREIVILLGEAESLKSAQALIKRFSDRKNIDEAFRKVRAQWDRTLSAIEIKTPDAAMNTLVNRWLPYQTLSCRLWARTGFYQSGGAYGFRDQLQDVMALVYSHPELARQQILRAAARQFKEGDVQHWWHPPTGRGVRTHFSDDLLWLPFVTAFYVRTTGDTAIFKEQIPFIDAPLLKPGQEDSYTHPALSTEHGSLLEHCARALDRSLAVGAHGLPLMGSGDWNDGMNRVGHEGRGESVWVGWFLHTVLEQLIPACEAGGFSERAATYHAHAAKLKGAIEENGWDGEWYRRAYFDDGTPLGTATNEECRIDSIAQSWSVLSGAGDPDRTRRAMAAVDVHLIQRENGLIRLFTPPFDRSTLEPGYIKGYVPGVRENGGQYTHAAIWTVMAYAELGDGDRATELFTLLNPINHSATRAGLHKYKVEPYVVAADVYGLAPHTGRGGWTWYTGSASWMYRAAIESILGFELQGGRFRFKPRIPIAWEGFEFTYRSGNATYHIMVSRKTDLESTGSQVELDGAALESGWVPLESDGRMHEVQIRI